MLPGNNFFVAFISPFISVPTSSANLPLFCSLPHRIKSLHPPELPGGRSRVAGPWGLIPGASLLQVHLGSEAVWGKFLLTFEEPLVRPAAERTVGPGQEERGGPSSGSGSRAVRDWSRTGFSGVGRGRRKSVVLGVSDTEDRALFLSPVAEGKKPQPILKQLSFRPGALTVPEAGWSEPRRKSACLQLVLGVPAPLPADPLTQAGSVWLSYIRYLIKPGAL